MTRRILIMNGHPDAAQPHFCGALVEAYAGAALAAGHEVRRINVATLDFPVLHSKQEFEHAALAPDIARAQESILWADHLLIAHPLWQGMMPALLKAFFEQVLRPEFVQHTGNGHAPQRPLKGKSARIVVTMGMPAFFYRWYFGAHGLKALRRSVLQFCGFGPVAATLVGNVESPTSASRARALKRMSVFGRIGR